MFITRRQLIKLIKENTEQFMKDFEEEMESFKDLPMGVARGDDYPAQFDPDYLYKGRPREYDKQGVGRAAYAVKKAWNKNVDREWVNSLVKIHWLSSLKGFIDAGTSSKDELSCATYTQEEYNRLGGSNWSGGEIGLVLKGFTTFLSPGTSTPGFYRQMAAVPGYIEGKKSSGISRLPLTFGDALTPEMFDIMDQGGFLYNEESWKKAKSADPRGIIESYVDNWQVDQIIFKDKETFAANKKDYDHFATTAVKNNMVTQDFVMKNYYNPKLLK
jgi:hypothetical protein